MMAGVEASTPAIMVNHIRQPLGIPFPIQPDFNPL